MNTPHIITQLLAPANPNKNVFSANENKPTTSFNTVLKNEVHHQTKSQRVQSNSAPNKPVPVKQKQNNQEETSPNSEIKMSELAGPPIDKQGDKTNQAAMDIDDQEPVEAPTNVAPQNEAAAILAFVDGINRLENGRNSISEDSLEPSKALQGIELNVPIRESTISIDNEVNVKIPQTAIQDQAAIDDTIALLPQTKQDSNSKTMVKDAPSIEPRRNDKGNNVPIKTSSTSTPDQLQNTEPDLFVERSGKNDEKLDSLANSERSPFITKDEKKSPTKINENMVARATPSNLNPAQQLASQATNERTMIEARQINTKNVQDTAITVELNPVHAAKKAQIEAKSDYNDANINNEKFAAALKHETTNAATAFSSTSLTNKNEVQQNHDIKIDKLENGPAPNMNKVVEANKAMIVPEQITPRVGTKAWDQAIGQKLVWMVAGGEQSAQLSLNPPDLGPLQVVLSISNSQVDASFISSHLDVREAIEAAAPKLREMMDSAGMSLSGFSVSSQSASSSNAFTQDQGSHRPRTNVSSTIETRNELSQTQVPTGISKKLGAVDTFV